MTAGGSKVQRRLVIATGLALGSGVLLSCAPQRPKFMSIDITGVDYARDFTLTDQGGQPRALKDFRDRILVVFFGFTHCPDVCPTTMLEMAQVKKLLGPDGAKLDVAFITVDPQRDTPELMRSYMTAFDPAFIALIPNADQLAAVAREFRIHYRKVDGTTPTSYTMEHTAAAFVFDTQGRVRLYARYGSGAESLVHDIRLLLQGA